MKKKLFALTMGLGIAFGAMNVSAKACHCGIVYNECVTQDDPMTYCHVEYQNCLAKYCRWL